MITDEPMDSCPHCGNDEYYVMQTFSGKGACNYRFDGGDADNTHMHDSVDYKEQKTAFCTNCQKKLGHVDKVRAKRTT